VSGSGPALRLRLANDAAALESTRLALLDFLQAFAPSAKAVYAVELVLEEVLTNQFKYAVAGRADAHIEFAAHIEHGHVVLSFEDDGPAFDPLQAPAPPPPRSIEEAPIGGLGLVLVRRFASSVSYVRRNGRNGLTAHVALA
jgi:anti-sigma regulatory factor (Ser/Thr protein kinase)